MDQSRGMYEPMAMLRSLAELQHKLQPDSCSNSLDFSSPTATNYEEALTKAIEDADYKSTPSFLAEENQVKVIDYKGEKVASFVIGDIEMICLPQVYELFLKTMVGGLHTVYTKLKRLEISPLVCNVEQVRALRSLGAIQPGVNRCKLIAKTDFDLLYDDCTSSCNRPGRPAKRVSDDWLSAQQCLASKQAKIEVGSPPLVSQSTPFSAESLLNSGSSTLLGSSLLSGMGSLHGQSALLGLLPGFNQILMQQVMAQQAKLRETRERECENEEDDGGRDGREQSGEEEEKDETHSSTEDSPMSNKSASKREQKSETRSRDDSSSRDESKSLSPNNNSTTLTSSPSGRSSQNQMNSPEFSKLVSLLENTMEQFKKREEVSDEKERRQRAEQQLAMERRRSNLYIMGWNRTRRELASLKERVRVLEQNARPV